MAAKVSTVVKFCHQALIEDKCVVIGLQNTIEAKIEETVAKYVSVLSATFWILIFITFILKKWKCIIVLRYPSIIWQGIELIDFISGTRKLLLKFVDTETWSNFFVLNFNMTCFVISSVSSWFLFSNFLHNRNWRQYFLA